MIEFTTVRITIRKGGVIVRAHRTNGRWTCRRFSNVTETSKLRLIRWAWNLRDHQKTALTVNIDEV